MALEFLRCSQKALLSAGYDDIILKVKEVICLESLYFKKDLVAVLPTGYGKSLIFSSSASIVEGKRGNTRNYVGNKSLVSPLNTLMYDQMSKLSAKTTESSDIPLSPCFSKFVAVTIKNPVSPPFQQNFYHPDSVWVVT